MKNYKIKLTTTEPILGSVPKNKEIYSEFIASRASVKSDGEDELDTVPEVEIEKTNHRISP